MLGLIARGPREGSKYIERVAVCDGMLSSVQF